MSLKTTLNIRLSKAEKIYLISQKFDLSISFILNTLFKMIFESHKFEAKFYKKIMYQDKIIDNSDRWKRLPISFQEDVYEKCLDMKKIFRLSSSFLLSEAIDKYLDKLLIELKLKKNSDNYTNNYLIYLTRDGYFNHITILWDMVDTETIKKLLEIHEKL